MWRRRGWALAVVALALWPSSGGAVGFRPAAAPAAKAPAPARTTPSPKSEPAKPHEPRLKPGEFVWTPELAGKGPMVMFVSLQDQEAYVYRGGVRIGVSTVSTGRKGYETPQGVFEVVQKQLMHHSNLYDDAPMPFMQRLTWDGLALHAGHVRGHPASHGCVRMPDGFAKALYAEATRGMTVVIASRALGPPTMETTEWIAPLDPPRAPDAESRVAALARDPNASGEVRIDDGDLAGARVLRPVGRAPDAPAPHAPSALDFAVEAVATAPGK
jgi:hypothetical protein